MRNSEIYGYWHLCCIFGFAGCLPAIVFVGNFYVPNDVVFFTKWMNWSFQIIGADFHGTFSKVERSAFLFSITYVSLLPFNLLSMYFFAKKMNVHDVFSLYALNDLKNGRLDRKKWGEVVGRFKFFGISLFFFALFILQIRSMGELIIFQKFGEISILEFLFINWIGIQFVMNFSYQVIFYLFSWRKILGGLNER